MRDFYFTLFPRVQYGNQVLVDLSKRFQVSEKFKNTSGVYLRDYIVRDNETPEYVSYKFYGSPMYWRFILDVNNIVDPFYEWPLFGKEFEDYVDAKYGEDKHSVKHYETDSGLIVDLPYSAEPVTEITNYDYETRINDEKRNIKIIKEEYLQEIVTVFKNTLMKKET